MNGDLLNEILIAEKNVSLSIVAHDNDTLLSATDLLFSDKVTRAVQEAFETPKQEVACEGEFERVVFYGSELVLSKGEQKEYAMYSDISLLAEPKERGVRFTVWRNKFGTSGVALDV